MFQFLVRDMMGMVGGVVFASLQGSTFDAYAKQWRLFADCLNNVGALHGRCESLSSRGPHMQPETWLCRISAGAAVTHGAIPVPASGVSRQRGTQHNRYVICGIEFMPSQN